MKPGDRFDERLSGYSTMAMDLCHLAACLVLAALTLPHRRPSPQEHWASRLFADVAWRAKIGAHPFSKSRSLVCKVKDVGDSIQYFIANLAGTISGDCLLYGNHQSTRMAGLRA